MSVFAKAIDVADAVVSSPTKWPKAARRTYLFTLPISVPLHAAFSAVIVLAMMATCVVCALLLYCHELWVGHET